MTDFITVADVNALLGPDWAGTGDPVLAVSMANAWLTTTTSFAALITPKNSSSRR